MPIDPNESALQQALVNTIVKSIDNLVIAVNAQTQVLKAVLPVAQSTTTSANAGTNGAPPAQVFEYLAATDPSGNAIRIPCYKP